jgi:hypothetical protein
MSDSGVYEVIEQIDQKHASGHKRHADLIAAYGARLQTVEEQVDRLERLCSDSKVRMDALEERKIEVSNLRFTPAMYIAGLVMCATIVGGQKWATSGFAEKQAEQTAAIALINVKMDAIKQHSDDNTKLQDERAATWTREITRISGQATMIDTKLSNLRETAIQNQRR